MSKFFSLLKAEGIHTVQPSHSQFYMLRLPYKHTYLEESIKAFFKKSNLVLNPMWLFRPTLHCQHAILRASSLPLVCSCPYLCLCLCVVWCVPWERHALMCSDFNNLSVGKFKQGSTCGHLPGGALVGRHSGICLTSGLRSLHFQVMCLRSFFFFQVY